MMAPELHDTLVSRLVADARPVRRVWSVGRRMALWLGLGAALFATVALVSPRPDLPARLAEPLFLVQIATLLTAAFAAALLALRAAVPGGEPAAPAWLLAVSLAALPACCLFLQPREPHLTPAAFLSAGVPCMLWTLAVGAPPWAALLVALRRGAPLAPGAAAALAGIAALLLATAILRTACPVDGRWHLTGWHLVPALAAALLSAPAARGWLQGWRSSPRASRE
jgi:hypothetical protein